MSRREIEIRASTSGYLVTLSVEEGDRVQGGDLLADFDNREAVKLVEKAKENLMLFQKEVVQGQRKLERVHALYEVGGKSRKTVEEVERQLYIMHSKEKAAEIEFELSRLQLDKLEIESPFGGLISQSLVKTGQWIDSGTLMFTLTDPKQLEVEVKIDAGDTGNVKRDQVVFVSTEAFPGDS